MSAYTITFDREEMERLLKSGFFKLMYEGGDLVHPHKKLDKAMIHFSNEYQGLRFTRFAHEGDPFAGGYYPRLEFLGKRDLYVSAQGCITVGIHVCFITPNMEETFLQLHHEKDGHKQIPVWSFDTRDIDGVVQVSFRFKNKRYKIGDYVIDGKNRHFMAKMDIENEILDVYVDGEKIIQFREEVSTFVGRVMPVCGLYSTVNRKSKSEIIIRNVYAVPQYDPTSLMKREDVEEMFQRYFYWIKPALD
jgi:hypothetical protein